VNPKPERVDNWLFIPVMLTLRERFKTLASAIDFLFTRKIDVHNEDGTWSLDQPYQADMRIGCFFSSLETFLLGYRYRMVDLKNDEDYQALKFMEWVETLDVDIRKAVIAEYKAAKEDGSDGGS